MKMKVLFVVHDLFQDNNLLQLGPAYLAAVARNAGYDVEVYSQDVYHYPNEHLAEYIRRKKFSVVGIGFLAARYPTVKKICEDVRPALDEVGAKLVLGGHGPTPIAEFVLQDTCADIVALGEAEVTFVNLLDAIANNDDLAQVDGIALNIGDEIIVNPRTKPVMDIDEIPFPARDLFPIDAYTVSQGFQGVNNGRSGTMITSRGCPYSCNFCYRMEKGIRLRSMESVMEEINFLKTEYHVDTVYFDDELLMSSKKRTYEFCEELLKQKNQISWCCNGRVNIVDSDLLKIMKRAGCFFINYGLESVDQAVLDTMDKKITVEQILKAAQDTRDIGVGSGLNIIFGHIGDTIENLWKGAEVIKKYHTYDQCRTIRPVTPYPGSGLYYHAIEKGLLKGPEDFFQKFKNSDHYMINFTDLPEEEIYKNLYEVNRMLVKEFYEHLSDKVVKGFSDLYFQSAYDFRGAR